MEKSLPIWEKLASLGGEISGLTNSNTYKVISAKSLFTSNTNLAYIELSSGSLPTIPTLPTATAFATNNTIIIPPPDPSNAQPQFYLNLTPEINVNKNYEILLIGISPSGRPWTTNSRTSAFLTSENSLISGIVDGDYTRNNPRKTIGMHQYRGNPSHCQQIKAQKACKV